MLVDGLANGVAASTLSDGREPVTRSVLTTARLASREWLLPDPRGIIRGFHAAYNRVMKYYRGTQFVPMQGTASMYYETGDDDSVVRFMTVLGESGSVERMPNPPMKRLFRPELLDEVTAEEFNALWNRE
jgi:hypothetical protein